MTSQFNMKKQIARDTYEDYKLYAEHGRTLEHSIGVNAINRNKSNPKEVLQWKMWEYSTLTNWGANERTPLLDIKGMNTISAEEHIKFLEEAVKMKYSDAKLKAITQSIDVIRKALLGDTIVKCSCCGEVFDYDNQPEIVLKEQVIDAVKSYDSWMKEGVAYKEIMKLANDIRSEVMTLIHTRKSINELSKHVLCPKCCNHVSKNDVVIKKEESKFSLKDLVDKIK